MAKILLIRRKTLSNQSIKELEMGLNDIFWIIWQLIWQMV